MKTKFCTILFLLIGVSFFHANSQTSILSPVNPGDQKITSVKAFESRYVDGKVYLHITINGNTETKFIAVERSLDETNYEVIGYIKIYGTTVQCDLAYYFSDESPMIANLYYRLSYYPFYDEPLYSETISVIPIDEKKSTAGALITTLISEEQTDFLSKAQIK